MSEVSGLAAKGISVSFGGVAALHDVSVSVDQGTLRGVIGPNGSGKTTLLNVISGFVQSTGHVFLDGRDISTVASYARSRRGVARSFQNPRVDRTLCVADLLRVGEHLRGTQPWWMTLVGPRFAGRDWRAFVGRAEALLQGLGLDTDVLSMPLTDASAGVIKLVDVARALLSEPKILLLDEPTSGMNELEIRNLRALLKDVSQGGTGVLVVEHNLQFVADTCPAVTVMAGGEAIAEGSLGDVLNRVDVAEAYFGSAPAALDIYPGSRS